MGSYSVLSIDRVSFAWKYDVPTFLTFLFRDEDFYSNVPEDPENADEARGWIGYRTGVEEARQRLDQLGFTRAFIAGIFDTLAPEIDASLRDSIAERIAPPVDDDTNQDEESRWRAARTAAEDALRTAATEPTIAQLEAFAAELRSALDSGSPPGFVAPLRGRFQGGPGEVMVDAHAMSFHLRERGDLNLAAIRVAELFAEWSDCPQEIQDLFLARLLLDVVPDGSVVDLDLTDLWDEEDFVGEPSRLAAQLVQRIQLYNRAFGVLLENENEVRRRAALIHVRELLRELPESTSVQVKGRLLEDLVATIFENHPGFVVAERRYDLGDQEIDLVIRNHVGNPFWTALASPLILVECKNWTSAVGTSEIRDFEGKLRDHPIARLGFFVAVNGFSSEVPSALQRAGREPYRLVTITGTDLERLVNEGLDVVEWLTQRIAALV